MAFRDQYIEETLSILKDRYDLSLLELIERYHGSITVPAGALRTSLTPLEAICSYLLEVRSLTEREIGKLLGRRTSSVKAALSNAKEKGESVREDEQAKYRIPIDILRDTKLSPAEAVVMSLHDQYGLSNADIARALAKDPRNTHTLFTRAQRKRRDAHE